MNTLMHLLLHEEIHSLIPICYSINVVFNWLTNGALIFLILWELVSMLLYLHCCLFSIFDWLRLWIKNLLSWTWIIDNLKTQPKNSIFIIFLTKICRAPIAWKKCRFPRKVPGFLQRMQTAEFCACFCEYYANFKFRW